MKYNILLKFLKVIIFTKRIFWWTGAKISFVLAKILYIFWKPLGYFNYKITYFFKRFGIGKRSELFLKRDYLQIIIFLVLFFVAIPQTKIYAKIYVQKDGFLPGQNTIAYTLSGADEEYSLEVVNADVNLDLIERVIPSWKEGVVNSDQNFGSDINLQDREFASIIAGGDALSKPILISGAEVIGKRDKIQDYIVQSGDSLGRIAYQFGVSVATILWENDLSLRSVIRPGETLSIPPTTGVMHIVKKGDTISKIAKKYDVKSIDVIVFNKLKEDGSDLRIGEKLMVPNGSKYNTVSPVKRSNPASRRIAVSVPSSSQSPSASGFVWPSGVKYITQYYSWKHHALDIAGPLNTPTYAAKAGVVEKAQCGWNSGYGCYVIINHGGGMKTLYGHHNKLLVSPGQKVKAGQTIALMGNTGKVRGVTGIHLHFEIRINGVRVNPLGYVK